MPLRKQRTHGLDRPYHLRGVMLPVPARRTLAVMQRDAG
jgi:hypothetical protein